MEQAIKIVRTFKLFFLLSFVLIATRCGQKDSGGNKKNGQLAHTGKPLNVVLFLVDDLGWKEAGCYGSSFYEQKISANGHKYMTVSMGYFQNQLIGLFFDKILK